MAQWILGVGLAILATRMVGSSLASAADSRPEVPEAPGAPGAPAPSRGIASPDGLRLTWSAPPECPDEAAVRGEIEHILGSPLRGPEAGQLVVRASVERSDTERFFRVRLEVTSSTSIEDSAGATTTRTIEAGTCAEVTGATALVLAILIDPNALARSRTSTGPSSESPPAPNPSAPLPPSADAPSPPWHASLEIGLGGGYLPSWSPGIGLEISRQWGRFRAVAGGLLWAPSSKTIDVHLSQSATFQLYSIHAGVCLELPTGSLEFGPCGGAEVAFLQGTSSGREISSDPHSATVGAFWFGGDLRWRVARQLWLTTRAEGLVPARTPTFVMGGTERTAVHQPASVGARVTIGAELGL